MKLESSRHIFEIYPELSNLKEICYDVR